MFLWMIVVIIEEKISLNIYKLTLEQKGISLERFKKRSTLMFALK